jgi:hypothetical protein
MAWVLMTVVLRDNHSGPSEQLNANQPAVAQVVRYSKCASQQAEIYGYKLNIVIAISFKFKIEYLKIGVNCKIWDFHGGVYEQCHLSGCGAVQILCKLTFQRNVSPPSSGQKNPRTRNQREQVATALVPRSLIFLPWRLRRYFPPKRRFTQDLHGTTSRKTAFFIVVTCPYA